MGIETVYKRGFFIGVVLLGSAAAYFQARAAAELLGAALLGSARVAAKAVAPPPAVTTARSGQSIVDRNPFDSSDRSPTSAQLAPSDTSDPLSWPDCEGVQALIVTESMDDPSWSLTTLRWPGEERGRARRVGDAVGAKQVAFIGYKPRQLMPAVWLTGDGTSCQSPLFRPPLPVTPREPELRVDRGLADETMRDPMAALRSIRVVPEMKDGVMIGLRLFGIRPNSLLASLGLQNGDRLESINGFNLTSAEKALEAYARLRSASEFRVRVERRGKPIEISVKIL